MIFLPPLTARCEKQATRQHMSERKFGAGCATRMKPERLLTSNSKRQKGRSRTPEVMKSTKKSDESTPCSIPESVGSSSWSYLHVFVSNTSQDPQCFCYEFKHQY